MAIHQGKNFKVFLGKQGRPNARIETSYGTYLLRMDKEIEGLYWLFIPFSIADHTRYIGIPIDNGTIVAITEALASIEEYLERKAISQDINRLISNIREAIGPDITKLLEFEPKIDKLIIKRKRYLDTSQWTTVNYAVRKLGGEWISAGKDSHWKISVSKTGIGKSGIELH